MMKSIKSLNKTASTKASVPTSSLPPWVLLGFQPEGSAVWEAVAESATGQPGESTGSWGLQGHRAILRQFSILGWERGWRGVSKTLPRFDLHTVESSHNWYFHALYVFFYKNNFNFLKQQK